MFGVWSYSTVVCNVTTYFENILFLVVTCNVYSVTLVTKFKLSVRYLFSICQL